MPEPLTTFALLVGLLLGAWVGYAIGWSRGYREWRRRYGRGLHWHAEGLTMMTLKDLLTSDCSSSPDGKHWEPAIPILPDWNWRDAWAVLRGRALAVRNTRKSDLGPR